MAASVLMTWAPHQERFPQSIDGNGTENGQLFGDPFSEDLKPEKSVLSRRVC